MVSSILYKCYNLIWVVYIGFRTEMSFLMIVNKCAKWNHVVWIKHFEITLFMHWTFMIYNNFQSAIWIELFTSNAI